MPAIASGSEKRAKGLVPYDVSTSGDSVSSDVSSSKISVQKFQKWLVRPEHHSAAYAN